MNKQDQETVSEYIPLDWYDESLLEIARVDFPDYERMIQVRSLCTVHDLELPPSERLRGAVSGEKPWTRATIRLTRRDLEKIDRSARRQASEWIP